jgi:GDPmannose 4,6-dehydratase
VTCTGSESRRCNCPCRPRYFRPAEVETLLGDPTKAKEKLGWVPEITVEEMCKEMVKSDLKRLSSMLF